jgi:hypothetical protein
MLRTRYVNSTRAAAQNFIQAAAFPRVTPRIELRALTQAGSCVRVPERTLDDWLMRKALPRTRKTKLGTKRAKVSIGVYLSIDGKNKK